MQLYPWIVAVALSVFTTSACATDGDLDVNFGTAGFTAFAASQVYYGPAVVVQPDGRIVICATTTGALSGNDFLIRRFEADGTPDVSFGDDGTTILTFDTQGTQDVCTALAIQTDGRIVVVGYIEIDEPFGFPLPQFAVARLDASGVLDEAFADGAGYTTVAFDGSEVAYAASVTIDRQDRIVVAGSVTLASNESAYTISRLLPDGSLDSSFGNGGSEALSVSSICCYEHVAKIAIDVDGRMLLAGFNGSSAITRLLDDGELDTSFGDNGSLVLFDPMNAVDLLIDAAGRIVMLGTSYVDSNSQNADFGVARLLEDGSSDESFGVNGIVHVPFDLVSAGSGNDVPFSMVLQSDQRLVIAGSGEYGTDQSEEAIAARLLENGSLDASFGTAGKVVFAPTATSPSLQTFTSLALQGGRAVLTGVSIDTNMGGAAANFIARFQNDGIFHGAFD